MSEIDNKYKELGGSTGVLGEATSIESSCQDGKGRFRHYQNGAIYWSAETGAHAVYGLIWIKWKALGFEKGPNGYPTTDEADTQSKRGRHNNFQNGTIIWLSGADEAFSVYGAIYAKWGVMKWDIGELGFPTIDETSTPNGIGRFNHFEHGSIYWTPDTGAHVAKGIIRSAWAAQGWEKCPLGFPISDEVVTPETNGQGRYQVFQGGEIFWTTQRGARIAIDDARRVPLVVVFAADSNGANDTRLNVSDEEVMELINFTNAIYEPDVGIKFALQEITSVKNTRINSLIDWNRAGCPEAEQNIPHPDPNIVSTHNNNLNLCEQEAYDFSAENFPGKIVVFIRSNCYDFDEISKSCKIVSAGGGGFSWWYLNFVALSPWTGGWPESYLAHELGHYFDIMHTFPNWNPDHPEYLDRAPVDGVEATEQLDRYCRNHFTDSGGVDHPENVPDNLPDLVWDFDKRYNPLLNDTPGDPGFWLYNNIVFGIGEHGETNTKGRCLGPGEYQVHSEYCNRHFTIRPPRQNVMNYTSHCPYTPGNTTNEVRARITPNQRQVIHNSLEGPRSNLGHAPYGFNCAEFLGRGWTHLMPFTTGHCFIAYNSASGSVQFISVRKPQGGWSTITGYEVLMKDTWGKGWSLLVPYTINKIPHFLAYNSTSGNMHFDRINSEGKSYSILSQKNWTKDLSHLMPFSVKGKPYLLAYNSNTGEACYCRISDDGSSLKILKEKSWVSGWSQLMPFELNGKPHIVAYNSSTGVINYDRINDNGDGVLILGTSELEKGVTQIAPYRIYDREWKNIFATYNSTTGGLKFHSINGAGTSSDVVWRENWPPYWSIILPLWVLVAVDMGVTKWFPYVVAYSTDCGKANIYQCRTYLR